ncbi:hypothetical protein MHZ90_19605 [Pantoea sp. ACRSH]|uniref:hypothetical protein n=1 Tax=unclassified Pantoea TaxID=2630326 RepID=UPI001EF66412|nr:MULTISPECIES: hypothetical protein [unclassified Pantoea]MCG7368309.1 hypothetical protein [Pantoea sp. ACRSH]MCG7398668.1 hypothetical protein [Pantoea sp. ACRSC]
MKNKDFEFYNEQISFVRNDLAGIIRRKVFRYYEEIQRGISSLLEILEEIYKYSYESANVNQFDKAEIQRSILELLEHIKAAKKVLKDMYQLQGELPQEGSNFLLDNSGLRIITQTNLVKLNDDSVNELKYKMKEGKKWK